MRSFAYLRYLEHCSNDDRLPRSLEDAHFSPKLLAFFAIVMLAYLEIRLVMSKLFKKTPIESRTCKLRSRCDSHEKVKKMEEGAQQDAESLNFQESAENRQFLRERKADERHVDVICYFLLHSVIASISFCHYWGVLGPTKSYTCGMIHMIASPLYKPFAPSLFSLLSTACHFAHWQVHHRLEPWKHRQMSMHTNTGTAPLDANWLTVCALLPILLWFLAYLIASVALVPLLIIFCPVSFTLLFFIPLLIMQIFTCTNWRRFNLEKLICMIRRKKWKKREQKKVDLSDSEGNEESALRKRYLRRCKRAEAGQLGGVWFAECHLDDTVQSRRRYTLTLATPSRTLWHATRSHRDLRHVDRLVRRKLGKETYEAYFGAANDCFFPSTDTIGCEEQLDMYSQALFEIVGPAVDDIEGNDLFCDGGAESTSSAVAMLTGPAAEERGCRWQCGGHSELRDEPVMLRLAAGSLLWFACMTSLLAALTFYTSPEHYMRYLRRVLMASTGLKLSLTRSAFITMPSLAVDFQQLLSWPIGLNFWKAQAPLVAALILLAVRGLFRGFNAVYFALSLDEGFLSQKGLYWLRTSSQCLDMMVLRSSGIILDIAHSLLKPDVFTIDEMVKDWVSAHRDAKSIDLSYESEVTDEAILFLAERMSSLESINLLGCYSLTVHSIVKLQETYRCKLRGFPWGFSGITDENLKRQAELYWQDNESISTVDFSGCHRISRGGLKEFIENISGLNRIVLRGCHIDKKFIDVLEALYFVEERNNDGVWNRLYEKKGTAQIEVRCQQCGGRFLHGVTESSASKDSESITCRICGFARRGKDPKVRVPSYTKEKSARESGWASDERFSRDEMDIDDIDWHMLKAEALPHLGQRATGPVAPNNNTKSMNWASVPVGSAI